MQQLGNLFAPATPRPSRWERNRYRHGAQFVDPAAVATPLDRNQRAKLLWHAEALERRTKLPGRRNGVLGYIGLAVLKALLLRFNGRAGCFPSLLTLQAATGLSRQAVADALARLERAGIIKIARRVVRTVVERVSPITGETQRFMTTVQASNCYGFAVSDGAAGIEKLLPGANARSFPVRRQRSLLECLLNSAAGSTGQSVTHK